MNKANKRNKETRQEKITSKGNTLYSICPIPNTKIMRKSGTEKYIITSDCYMLSLYFAKFCLSTKSIFPFLKTWAYSLKNNFYNAISVVVLFSQLKIKKLKTFSWLFDVLMDYEKNLFFHLVLSWEVMVLMDWLFSRQLPDRHWFKISVWVKGTRSTLCTRWKPAVISEVRFLSPGTSPRWWKPLLYIVHHFQKALVKIG